MSNSNYVFETIEISQENILKQISDVESFGTLQKVAGLDLDTKGLTDTEAISILKNVARFKQRRSRYVGDKTKIVLHEGLLTKAMGEDLLILKPDNTGTVRLPIDPQVMTLAKMANATTVVSEEAKESGYYDPWNLIGRYILSFVLTFILLLLYFLSTTNQWGTVTIETDFSSFYSWTDLLMYSFVIFIAFQVCYMIKIVLRTMERIIARTQYSDKTTKYFNASILTTVPSDFGGSIYDRRQKVTLKYGSKYEGTEMKEALNSLLVRAIKMNGKVVILLNRQVESWNFNPKTMVLNIDHGATFAIEFGGNDSNDKDMLLIERDGPTTEWYNKLIFPVEARIKEIGSKLFLD